MIISTYSFMGRQFIMLAYAVSFGNHCLLDTTSFRSSVLCGRLLIDYLKLGAIFNHKNLQSQISAHPTLNSFFTLHAQLAQPKPPMAEIGLGTLIETP